jgi:uncharacterized membrane protein
MPTNLVLAAATFILAHRLIAGSRLRTIIVDRIGERAFQAAFSILSVVMTTWLVWAYLAVAPTAREAPSPIAKAVVIGASALACYLIVAGLTTRNPTIVGLARVAQRADAVHGVIRLTRHPFLIGIVLLSVSHLLVSHAPVDWLFFGTLAFVALIGMRSIDAKRARLLGADWEPFRRATSVVPAAAILAGRQIFRISEIGLLRPVLGVLLFALGSLLHPA